MRLARPKEAPPIPSAGADEELLARARAGDTAAFGPLVDRYQRRVVGFLLTFFHDLDLAEDCAQEAFIKAFKSLHRFEDRSSFNTWVSRIALNTARTRLHWNRLRQCLPIALRGEPSPWEYQLREIVRGDGELEDLERRLDLERAMKGLSMREREIVALRLEGYVLEDIAQILRISEGTVKSTLFTATHKMKKEMSP